MKLYVAIIDDRHTDPEPHVFSTPELAIDYARHYYESNVPPGITSEDSEDIGEHETDGWLYHATYSTEGDAVWVVEAELDATT